MKNYLKILLTVLATSVVVMGTSSAQAFWGPFDFFDDDDYYGGPWGGGPWGGYPGGYGGYPYGGG